MAFNLTSWSRKGRNYGRGEPPPRGSIEWIAVGDMWEPEPPSSAMGNIPPSSAMGNIPPPRKLDENASYTEMDAADRWMQTVDRSVRYARQIHGDKILSKADESFWTTLMAKWTPFRASNSTRTTDNRKQFDILLNESKVLHDRFVSKGMGIIPVPYAAELVALLREMPKKLTAKDMAGKLDAAVKCGEKLLDDSYPWYYWMIPVAVAVKAVTSAMRSNDTKGLRTAISEAQKAADIFKKASRAPETYGPGDPVYDEFLRRLTRIWIEAAGLYGIQETQQSAKAEAKDVAQAALKRAPENTLWLLAAAGVAYLGLHWLVGRPRETVIIAVPDLDDDDLDAADLDATDEIEAHDHYYDPRDKERT